MTPTEQDEKIREQTVKLLLDWEKAYSVDLSIEDKHALLYGVVPNIIELITADRERVASGAKIEALDYVIDLQDKEFIVWTQTDIANLFDGIGEYYRELKSKRIDYDNL